MSGIGAATQKYADAVIKDVIASIREEFLAQGVGEDVVDDLQELWREKLNQARVFPTSANVVYAPASRARGTSSKTNDKNTTGTNTDASTSSGDNPTTTAAAGATLPYPLRNSTADQTPSVPASLAALPSLPLAPSASLAATPTLDKPKDGSTSKKSAMDLRTEGMIDPDDDDNSSLGDDDDDDEPDDNPDEFLVCQYTKVTRKKTQWKCQLKSGVLHSGDVEYVFQKASLEMDW